MTFEAKIILDSQQGHHRLTTMQLRYPRFIHAEFMTHRVFSRNASSSRAIPVEKMIKQVSENPAMPVHWGQNQRGMQAEQELTLGQQHIAKELWQDAAKRAVFVANSMMELGLHKQVANRILEPFQFISVVVTSTEWANFFALRLHKDADPNIQHLAKLMHGAMANSAPKELVGKTANTTFHLPYIKEEEWPLFSAEALTKFSVARCARVSYLTHDGENPDPIKDMELYDRLVSGQPMHASPTEHQGRITHWADSKYHGNFNCHWMQFRKALEIGKPEMFWSPWA